MELEYEPTLESAHVRFSSQDAVVQALMRLEICRGAAVPVWPPRPLPGPDWVWVFVSPVREGWVSRARAREVYGVEVDETGEVVVETTRERRAGMAEVGQ